MTSSQASSHEEEIMDMTCPHCQRSVPTANMDVHSARCNRGRLNSPPQQEPTNTQEQQSDSPQQQQEESNDSISRNASNVPRNNSFTSRGNSNSDWIIVNPAVMSPRRSNRQTSQSDDTVQLREGQWRCSRCTLVNEGHLLMCDACLLPRHINRNNTNNDSVAQRNAALTTRISNDTLNGSNITYRSTMNNLSPANRILNGAINGAMVGSVFGGVGGLIVGGITGAASGMFIDRVRSRGEQLEASERQMILNDNGGIQPGTMRVHRGENFITAASTNRHGSTRVIRLRYSTGHLPGRAATPDQEQIERTLLELLLRQSYNRQMSTVNHVIIQPEATFEDLIERFGTGLEGRGASQEVIDSYPVEIVGADGRDGGCCEERTSSDKSDDDSESAKKKPKIDVGTCNICLEDYQAGEEKKSLSCPHEFHKGCIDQWLKRVASCPVCKADVGMYKKPPEEKHVEESS
ncbi:RING finger protein [Skeletonema marinoi]|uniref:RING finger protein n=2 Tax=Skeletonema marinoi TaxID=267567 RepID=A0AAD9DHK6_9STRA|nr:RING finger protein [Skeletonema marinoi]